MSKILFSITVLFSFSLFATSINPRPYAALGDVIYNNVDSIHMLADIESYELYRDEINSYVLEVSEVKREGFALELKSSSKSKKEYLTKLRVLSKKNDYYLRDIKSRYKLSMQMNRYKMFSQFINSGLIDTKRHKKEIIDYYYLHSKEINSTGLIDEYLKEDARLKALKDAELKRRKSKKTLQEEKIARIRKMDLEAQKKLELKLQKDLKQKKLEIRENQKKELAN